ncbi:MAG TPA: methyltransferase domain-containing protein [Acidimicrobiales bacterium]|nr:methyltransferase domain-containing protein [Acidimicrobiales bacterium]
MTETANADQHAAWNGDSGRRWVADADRRDRVLAPIADALLDGADLRPGDRVLDVGCGCGATSLAGARAVGPSGDVLGIDLSAPMLEAARARADDQGATNVSFVLGDAQTHALPPATFAVAISRFGTMFFADPVAAFANIATALAPAGRLCLATWQPLAANDWLTIPGAVLLAGGGLPEAPPGSPGMFAQSDPATVTASLHRAGYTDIGLDAVTVTLTLGSDPADAADYLANTGIGQAALASIPDGQRAAALDAVQAVLADHADATGVRLAAAIWIVTATLRS